MGSSRPIPLPPPIGGLNTRDSLQDMPPEDAVILTNWFPDTGNVKLRRGHASHSTGLGGVVETLAEYNATTLRKLIAAANGKIWNATAAGAATELATGFTSNRWQWANFNASMGLVNGADAPQTFDGTSVAAMTVSGSGLTVANLVGINVHKTRSYFWEVNSQDFWYSAVNALGGVLTKFPLSRLSQLGGNLVLMATWTIDGGNGPDDLAVFVMSSGEAFVYQGGDPGSASDWSLIGRYLIGVPLSVRSAVKLGGDMRLITREDYASLSDALRSARDKSELPRSKAVGALQQEVRSYSSNFGWQALLYRNMLIFNVPKTSAVFEQHVMNTTTGAWCKFSGWNARCFGVYNNDLYFGGSGVVYKADTGTTDNGSAITADAMPAWNLIRSSGKKHVVALQNLFEVNSGTVQIGLAVATDFQTPTPPALTASDLDSGNTGTAWGSAWGSPWSSESKIYAPWESADAYGTYITHRIRLATGAATVNWNSYSYLVQPVRAGGAL